MPRPRGDGSPFAMVACDLEGDAARVFAGSPDDFRYLRVAALGAVSMAMSLLHPHLASPVTDPNDTESEAFWREVFTDMSTVALNAKLNPGGVRTAARGDWSGPSEPLLVVAGHESEAGVFALPHYSRPVDDSEIFRAYAALRMHLRALGVDDTMTQAMQILRHIDLDPDDQVFSGVIAPGLILDEAIGRSVRARSRQGAPSVGISISITTRRSGAIVREQTVKRNFSPDGATDLDLWATRTMVAETDFGDWRYGPPSGTQLSARPWGIRHDDHETTTEFVVEFDDAWSPFTLHAIFLHIMSIFAANHPELLDD